VIARSPSRTSSPSCVRPRDATLPVRDLGRAGAVVEILGTPSYRAAAERTTAWFDDGILRAVEALEALAGG
jgi:hypothetical protein